jgi:uncharacterized Zn-finger protein
MSEQDKQSACVEKIYQVHSSDLPLSCPTADMNTWNAHPRVYLDIESKGSVDCPYCGAHFEFVTTCP